MNFKQFLPSRANTNYINQNRKVLKEVKKMLLYLLLGFVFLILWSNKSKIYPENITIYLENCFKSAFKSSEFPKKINGDKVPYECFGFLGNDIVALSDTSFTALNKSAYIIRKEFHNLNRPCMKSANMRAIIYDGEGKSFKIESASRTLYSAESENNIISADILDSGTYSLLTESQNYLSQCTVWNRKNIEKYKYCFSEIYATSVSLNPSGTKAAVGGVSLNDGTVDSSIYVLNFKSEKPEYIFKLEDNSVTDVRYFSNGNILAIGDKYLCVINPKSKKVKKFHYDKKSLKFYDFSMDSGLVCCLSLPSCENQNNEIYLIDALGEQKTCIKTCQSLKSVSHTKNRIFALSDDKLAVYGLDGKFHGYINVKNIYRKIISCSGSQTYLLQNKTIDKIKISHLKKSDHLNI